MSTISAGTTTTTALINTGDTTGNLVLQVNGSTNAVSLNTSGAVGVGSSPSYGTTGQTLVSNGSAAAPSWGSSLVLATVQASTTGTVVEFLSIPSWVRRITMMLNAVSTNGTSIKQVQLGTSGGYQTTGYAGGSTGFGTSTLTTTNYTTGFAIRSASATEAINGSIILSLLDSANGIWVAQGVMSDTTANGAWITSGAKTLSGTLDRVRLTTVNGTDAFDAGSVNILYE